MWLITSLMESFASDFQLCFFRDQMLVPKTSQPGTHLVPACFWNPAFILDHAFIKIWTEIHIEQQWLTICVADSLLAAGWFRRRSVPGRTGCGSGPAVPGGMLMICWIFALQMSSFLFRNSSVIPPGHLTISSFPIACYRSLGADVTEIQCQIQNPFVREEASTAHSCSLAPSSLVKQY